MVREVTVPAKECTCDLCAHVWISIAKKLPEKCAKCRSREWNGQKRNSHVNEIKFPAPRKAGRPKKTDFEL